MQILEPVEKDEPLVEEILKVRQQRGAITKEHILEAAADEDSPLHGEFTWDDELAGHQYRLVEAGMLLRRLKVRIVRRDRDSNEIKVKTIRAFESRPSMRNDQGGYETIQEIMADPVKTTEMIQHALRELELLRQRYDHLKELANLWAELDRISGEAAD
jgi:hypothetical protein